MEDLNSVESENSKMNENIEENLHNEETEMNKNVEENLNNQESEISEMKSCEATAVQSDEKKGFVKLPACYQRMFNKLKKQGKTREEALNIVENKMKEDESQKTEATTMETFELNADSQAENLQIENQDLTENILNVEENIETQEPSVNQDEEMKSAETEVAQSDEDKDFITLPVYYQQMFTELKKQGQTREEALTIVEYQMEVDKNHTKCETTTQPDQNLQEADSTIEENQNVAQLKPKEPRPQIYLTWPRLHQRRFDKLVNNQGKSNEEAVEIVEQAIRDYEKGVLEGTIKAPIKIPSEIEDVKRYRKEYRSLVESGWNPEMAQAKVNETKEKDRIIEDIRKQTWSNAMKKKVKKYVEEGMDYDNAIRRFREEFRNSYVNQYVEPPVQMPLQPIQPPLALPVPLFPMNSTLSLLLPLIIAAKAVQNITAAQAQAVPVQQYTGTSQLAPIQTTSVQQSFTTTQITPVQMPEPLPAAPEPMAVEQMYHQPYDESEIYVPEGLQSEAKQTVKVRRQSKKKVTPETPDGFYRVSILAKGFPNEFLSRSEIARIEESILELVIRDNLKNKLKFIDFCHSPRWLSIICGNSDTVIWIRKNLQNIRFTRGRGLYMRIRSEKSDEFRVIGQFPDSSQYSNERILDIIDALNEGKLEASCWTVVQRLNIENVAFLTLVIGERAAIDLMKKNEEIFYRFGKIKLNIVCPEVSKLFGDLN